MTTTTLDYEAHEENTAKLAELRAEIDRLEAFETLTTAQTRKLSALRQSFEVTDELRKEHERARLLELVNDPTAHRENGHTPRDLDDDPWGD